MEAGAGESEHRKRKRRESLSPAEEPPAVNGVHDAAGTPGMTPCLQLLCCPHSPSTLECGPQCVLAPTAARWSRPPALCPWLACPQACAPPLPEGCAAVPWVRVCSPPACADGLREG